MAEPAGARSGNILWALLAAALAVRLVFFWLLPAGDDGSDSYIQPALELLRSGHYDSFATLHRLPGAPWFFSLVFSLFGVRTWAVAFVQHLLGTLTFWLVLDTADRAWGRRAAIAAGLLFLGLLQFPYRECFLLSEALAHFFFAAALWSGVRVFLDPDRPRWFWALAGAAASAAALTRGEFLVVGGVVGLGLALGVKRPWRKIAAYLACWSLPLLFWVARNQALFGYAGLTPDSITTVIDTALPLVRYDSPDNALAKGVLKEQVEAAANRPGLDPRPTTIERLQNEHGMSYLQAELALGAVAREAAFSRPLTYLGLASRNFRMYLAPARWATQTSSGPKSPDLSSLAAGDDYFRAAAARLVSATESWGWVVLILAACAPLAAFSKGGGRGAAGLVGACWLALWTAVSFTDYIVPRIQTELFLPLGLLGAFTAAAAWDRALPRRSGTP